MEQWDAIVVGAGPSGTLVAECLLNRGLSVLVLDGGPRPGTDGTIPEVDEKAWKFETPALPCDWLRVRAVGGASLAWGGWSNRFPNSVLLRGGWPCDADELAPFYTQVERRIEVVDTPLLPRHRQLADSLGLTVLPMRCSRMPGSPWRASSSPVSKSVRADTIVTRIHHDARGSALEVTAANGSTSSLSARAVVLAASPVETTRLLLASGAGELCPRIGCGLTYHPVVGYALIEAGSADETSTCGALVVAGDHCNGLLGPDFSVEITGPHRFAALASELRQRIRPQGELPPDPQVTFIHTMGELKPSPARRVDLSPTTRDTLGRAVPRIHLAWSDAELAWIADMQRAAISIAEALAPKGGTLVEYSDPICAPILFHEAGTCSMGTSIEAPCDPWGRLNALRNVWVADASVFPSAGDRHPTLTILAFASRAANSAAQWLGA